MADLKLSDLNPEDVKPVGPKLSDISPDEVKPIAQTQSPQQSPSPDQSQDQEQQIGPLKAGAMGVIQGGTMGFADEIEGALKALGEKGEKIIKHEDTKDLKELYKQYRDQARQKYKQAQEQQPASYFAGNVAGGVGTAALTGGASVGGMAALGAVQGLGSSEGDLTDATPSDLLKTAKDVGVGAGVGALGGYLGGKIAGALTPEATEAAAGRMASSAAGLSKEMALSKKGIDVAQVGNTALQEGASPLMGGAKNILAKTQEAIERNEDKLTPLFQKAQNVIDEKLTPELVDQVGHIGDKLENSLSSYGEQISKLPKADQIMAKLQESYKPYIDKVSSIDGNLMELNKYKQALQQSARDLGAYSKQFPELAPEAQLVKKMAGVVREHIEDLANSAGENFGSQISSVNKSLSNLYTYEDAAMKLVDKDSLRKFLDMKDISGAAIGTATGSLPIVGPLLIGKKIAEKATGNPIERTVQQLGAKALSATSKALQSDIGDILINKGVSNAAASSISNPWNIEKLQNKTNNLIPYTMYNASDESLRDIADRLKETKETSMYGQMLNDALDNNDSFEKSKAIFLMMGNPQTRKLFAPKEEK
jgi:hypothetical protein